MAIRRFRIAVTATCLAGLFALACGQPAGKPGATGGQAGPGGSRPDDAGSASTGGVGGIPNGGSAAGGQASTLLGGATASTRGTGGPASGGVTMGSAGVTGAQGGGVAGTKWEGDASAAGGATATGGAGGTSSGGGDGATDAARADAYQDAPERDSAVRDVLAERVDSGETGGARSDGPPASDASGDGAGTNKIKVWLSGDSTMMECTDACPCGWGSQFQALLNANATVVNSAVGGRSIQTWLYDPNVSTTMDANGECVVSPKTYSTRWQAMLDTSTGMKPGDFLLIEFGINDGDSTCNRHVGSALFQSYLGTMAQAAKAMGAQPVFLTSTSYIGCSGSTATANRGFVSEAKTAGQSNDVPVIDLTALSAALYTSLGLCPNDGDYTSTTSAVGKFFCDDHTHFEAAGATQIAKLVAKALKDQGIGLAAYLR